ncbi:MAG: hypothetical protein M3275_10420 [Thermoproteota archaeon]|nr:hypothetical protein [Thermoproteota archaeon]
MQGKSKRTFTDRFVKMVNEYVEMKVHFRYHGGIDRSVRRQSKTCRYCSSDE